MFCGPILQFIYLKFGVEKVPNMISLHYLNHRLDTMVIDLLQISILCRFQLLYRRLFPVLGLKEEKLFL
jgi:hypothetical protein